MKTSFPKRKRSVFIVLSLTIIILGTLTALPFVIDVDKYRPEILKLVNSKLNGQLSLGRLRLSLWGKIAVGVEKAELVDDKNRTVLSVGHFDLAISPLSLLQRSLSVRVQMQKPVISVHRDKTGLWNVAYLVKGKTPEAPQEEKTEQPSPTQEPPEWVKKSQLSLAIEEAEIKVTDEKSDSQFGLQNLRIKTGVLSLTTLPDFIIQANVNTVVGNGGRVQGPFTFEGKVSGNSLELDAKLDSVGVEMEPVFLKKPGVKLGLSCIVERAAQDVLFSKGLFQLHKASLSFDGKLSFEGEKEPHFSANVKTDALELGDLKEVLPAAERASLEGKLNAAVSLSGTTSTPQGEVEASLAGVNYQGEFFKQPLAVAVQLKSSLDRLEKIEAKLTGKGFDLALLGGPTSLKYPKLNMNIDSQGMDLDELIDWEKMKKAKLDRIQKNKSDEARPADAKPTGKVVPAEDYDSTVGLLRKSELAKKMEGVIFVNIKTLKLYNATLEPVKGKIDLKSLRFAADFDSARIFSGNIKASGLLNLEPSPPEYRFETAVNGMSLKDAVSSQMELFKNTFTGTLKGEMKGVGKSLNPTLAMKNLDAAGKLEVQPAQLSTIDINRVLKESLGESITKVGDKIPSMKGKQLKVEPTQSEFQKIVTSFTVQDGVFFSPDFSAQAVPQKGVDLKGTTRLGLLDYALNAEWNVIDTYNLLHAKELALEEGGVRVDSVLVEKGKPFQFPIRVRGTLLKPEYDYGAVPEALAKTALANMASAAKEKVSAEARKKAQQELQKITEKAPEPVKNILKGIFK